MAPETCAGLETEQLSSAYCNIVHVASGHLDLLGKAGQLPGGPLSAHSITHEGAAFRDELKTE